MKSLLRLLGLVVLLAAPARVEAGPAIDPRQMSGIPRPDGTLPSGAITVRVLKGGFDSPAVDTEVTLEIVGADGKTTEQKSMTNGEGRAGFSGLAVGSRATAKVELDGESLASQPIEVLADTGTRVMLVAGASASAGTPKAPAHGQATGPAVPVPGTAFPLEGTPKGDLVVGTFDLGERKPIEGVVVTLTIETPDGKTETREGKTDRGGRFVFKELAEPTLPVGTKFHVAGTLEKGGQVQTSKTFTMEGDVGLAVVLAKGSLPAEMPQERPAAAAPLPGPRLDGSLPDGTVRVRVVDGHDRPVAEQPVVVVKKDMANTDTPFPAVTDANGVVDVEVDVASDAFYFVEARYDGAPYQSSFFPVDKRGGVAVDLRVYPTTSDPRVVRSAVQFDIDGLENDVARVVQFYQVMVTGDKAFWPEGGFTLMPALDGHGIHVPEFSEEYLSHEDKAQPFATLANPIPPGELTNLTIMYLVDHDGTAEIDWEPPFALVETSVLVGADQTLTATGARASDQKDGPSEKTSQLLGPRRVGEVVEFTIGGLPVRNPIYRWIGAIVASVIGLVGLGAVMSRPMANSHVRLQTRRDELLATLDKTPDGPARERIITALDGVYRQLDAVKAADRARKAKLKPAGPMPPASKA